MTTVKLTKPLDNAGKPITEVTVRAATLADMLASDLVKGERTKEAVIYASITGVPFPAFQQLAPADYMAIVSAADALSGNALTSTDGGTPPA